MFQDLRNKYTVNAQRLGFDIYIRFVHGDHPLQQTKGSTVSLNVDKIPASEMESYIAYNVRKIIVPRLTLETQRIIIRRFDISDAEELLSLYSDRESCYSDGGYEPFTGMDERYMDLMRSFAVAENKKVLTLKNKELIGIINLKEVNDRAVEAYEIGYAILPKQRRKGYAAESVGAVCDCLLEKLRADMIIAGAIEENIPSIRTLTRLGFQYEGRKHKAFWHPEHGPIDLLYYFKERSDL